ncbi:MAG: 16S rRNA (guanine(1405)-N(7))-methyltransferase RmtG [Clostridia bacterium]|nr:16S rRNA (guanine(1405)-N(7))-methyltransferase RmtG [Clostridia bacterium]
MNIDALYERISNSKKYRDICPDTVMRLLNELAGRYKSDKALERAVREKLHGVAGAYLPLERMELPVNMEDDAALEQVLSMHVSTRERLPLSALDALYARLFQTTGEPRSILDLACGLNPLYLKARYPAAEPILGIDISKRCAELCGGSCVDLLTEAALPKGRFHVALMLKMLPLMERERAGAANMLLREVNAEFIIASFPTRSLGGRNVGMAAHYERWLMERLPQGRKVTNRYETVNEVYYILEEGEYAQTLRCGDAHRQPE